jgi:hypothetical protein
MEHNEDKQAWVTTVEERDRLRSIVVRVPTVESFRELHHEVASPNGFAVDAELELPMGSRLPLFIEPPAGEEPVKIPATVLFATPRQTIVSLQLDHPRVAVRWRELEEDFGICDHGEEPPHAPEEPEPTIEPELNGLDLILTPSSETGMPSLSNLRGRTDEFLGALVPSIDLEPDPQPPTAAPSVPAQTEARGGFTSRVQGTGGSSNAPIRKRRDVVRRPRNFGTKTVASPVPHMSDDADEAKPAPPPSPSRPGIRKGMAARRREENEE